MADQARVTSIDALHDFRAALANFTEEAEGGLVAVELEINRFLDWLSGDQLSYWQHQVVRLQEKVAEAKGDLHRKKLTATFGEHRSVVEEQVAIKKAKLRLEEAEEKVQKIRKWTRALEDAISEYHGQVQPLGDHLAQELPRSQAVLSRMIRSLESYASSRPAAPSSQGTAESDAQADDGDADSSQQDSSE